MQRVNALSLSKVLMLRTHAPAHSLYRQHSLAVGLTGILMTETNSIAQVLKRRASEQHQLNTKASGYGLGHWHVLSTQLERSQCIRRRSSRHQIYVQLAAVSWTPAVDLVGNHVVVLTCCVAVLQAMASDASWNASRKASPSVVTSYPLYCLSWVLIPWSCTSMARSITSRSCAGQNCVQVTIGCRLRLGAGQVGCRSEMCAGHNWATAKSGTPKRRERRNTQRDRQTYRQTDPTDWQADR